LSSFSSMQDYSEIVDFFKNKDTSKFDMTVQQILETIKTSAKWIEHATDDIRNWLEARASAP